MPVTTRLQRHLEAVSETATEPSAGRPAATDLVEPSVVTAQARAGGAYPVDGPHSARVLAGIQRQRSLF
jgi:hypothetical protein